MTVEEVALIELIKEQLRGAIKTPFSDTQFAEQAIKNLQEQHPDWIMVYDEATQEILVQIPMEPALEEVKL